MHFILVIVTFQQITGKWSGETAGGCPNHQATYKNNPIYQFRIESDLTCLRIELKAPKDIQVFMALIPDGIFSLITINPLKITLSNISMYY